MLTLFWSFRGRRLRREPAWRSTRLCVSCFLMIVQQESSTHWKLSPRNAVKIQIFSKLKCTDKTVELMEVVIHQESNGNPNLLEFIISPGKNESSAWPGFDRSSVTATVSSCDRTDPDKGKSLLLVHVWIVILCNIITPSLIQLLLLRIRDDDVWRHISH